MATLLTTTPTHKVSRLCQAADVRDAVLPACGKLTQVEAAWQENRYGLCKSCLAKLKPALERKGIQIPSEA